MTSFGSSVHYELTQNEVSGYCANCGEIIPIESSVCSIDFNLTGASPNQLVVFMPKMTPYTSGQKLNTTFAGICCPKCKKPMAFVDANIAKYLKIFNDLKLFTAFSCQGHYVVGTDPNTGLVDYIDCSTPYISFIGSGKLLKDILAWKIRSSGCAIRIINETEYSVVASDEEGKEWTKPLSLIKFDTKISTIYSVFDPIDEEVAVRGQTTFLEALDVLTSNLKTWIHEWLAYSDDCESKNIYLDNLLKNAKPETAVLKFYEQGASLSDE